MDYDFEGIPTIPPRKDVDHMAFFCSGCRYRVTAYPDWTVAKVNNTNMNAQIPICMLLDLKYSSAAIFPCA